MITRSDISQAIENDSSNKSDSQNEDEEYFEVEKILDKKIGPFGKILYKVKWVGYSEEESTWEPLENLTAVLDLVEKFEKRGNRFTYDSYHEKNSLSDDSGLGEVIFRENFNSNLSNNFLSKKTKRAPSNTVSKSTNNKTSCPKENNIYSSIRNNTRGDKTSADYKYYPVEKKLTSINNPEEKNYINPVGIKNVKTRNLSQIYITENDFEGYLQGNISSDTPKSILLAKLIGDNIYFLVTWNPRADGTVPEDLLISNKMMKELYPHLLLEFYEKRLKFGDKFLKLDDEGAHLTDTQPEEEGSCLEVNKENSQKEQKLNHNPFDDYDKN